MRRSTQIVAPLLLVLLAALVAFPSLFSLHRSPVSAFAPQDQSRSDVKAKIKRTAGPRPLAINGASPANDNCANAVAITNCPFTDVRSNAGATEETGEPAPCGAIAATIWYSYTNSGANPVVINISLCDSVPVDTALAVYKVNGAACDFANFQNIGCNDDSSCGDGFQSQLGFTADPGATYKIQVGGFDGDTGTLTVDVTCQEVLCDNIVINGTIGSGAPGFTGTQFSGLQLGRLNRNGVGSTCAVPKNCDIIDPTGLRAFDAYEIHNDSGEDQCVTINLTAPADVVCNIQSNAYLDTYDPNAICTGYLGDAGLSLGVPPTPTTFSVVVPADKTLIVVAHVVNPGETGCPYTITIQGNLCAGFDACVQDDRTPGRFILVNTVNGKYEFHDCSKGVVLAGTGVVQPAGPPPNCKFFLNDSGPIPKRPDRAVHVEINVCTFAANASVRFPPSSKTPFTLLDSNYTNNNCVCP
jgi:hypothetical protein